MADFGEEKHITVGVATLEPSDKTSSIPCLHVKAASSSIELAVVGKKLHKRFKRGVSYQAVAANRPVHVTDIQKHGGVYFFIPEHAKEEVHIKIYTVLPKSGNNTKCLIFPCHAVQRSIGCVSHHYSQASGSGYHQCGLTKQLS